MAQIPTILESIKARAENYEPFAVIQAKLHADTFVDLDNPEGWDAYTTSARVENARLQPIITALIEVCAIQNEVLEFVIANSGTYTDYNLKAREALTRAAALLVKLEG